MQSDHDHLVAGSVLSSQLGGQNLWVLLLGHIKESWSADGRVFCKHAGSLLRRAESSDEKDWKEVLCERLGVCTWFASSDWQEKVIDQLPWHQVNGLEMR